MTTDTSVQRLLEINHMTLTTQPMITKITTLIMKMTTTTMITTITN